MRVAEVAWHKLVYDKDPRRATQKVHSLRMHTHLTEAYNTEVPEQLCRLRCQGVQSRCRCGQFSLSVHAVPSHMLAGFSSTVVALQKCARLQFRRAQSRRRCGRFCGRSACVGGFQFHCASSATVAAGVSFSARQLPMRPVSGSVSSDGPVMNASWRAVTV